MQYFKCTLEKCLSSCLKLNILSTPTILLSIMPMNSAGMLKRVYSKIHVSCQNDYPHFMVKNCIIIQSEMFDYLYCNVDSTMHVQR